jgi:hypothetical protein
MATMTSVSIASELNEVKKAMLESQLILYKGQRLLHSKIL